MPKTGQVYSITIVTLLLPYKFAKNWSCILHHHSNSTHGHGSRSHSCLQSLMMRYRDFNTIINFSNDLLTCMEHPTIPVRNTLGTLLDTATRAEPGFIRVQMPLLLGNVHSDSVANIWRFRLPFFNRYVRTTVAFADLSNAVEVEVTTCIWNISHKTLDEESSF